MAPMALKAHGWRVEGFGHGICYKSMQLPSPMIWRMAADKPAAVIDCQRG
jgi:hypothetical protein